jgi:hypothetical protein
VFFHPYVFSFILLVVASVLCLLRAALALSLRLVLVVAQLMVVD